MFRNCHPINAIQVFDSGQNILDSEKRQISNDSLTLRRSMRSSQSLTGDESSSVTGNRLNALCEDRRLSLRAR